MKGEVENDVEVIGRKAGIDAEMKVQDPAPVPPFGLQRKHTAARDTVLAHVGMELIRIILPGVLCLLKDVGANPIGPGEVCPFFGQAGVRCRSKSFAWRRRSGRSGTNRRRKSPKRGRR